LCQGARALGGLPALGFRGQQVVVTLLSLFAFHEVVAMGCLLSVDWLGEPLARASRLIVCECPLATLATELRAVDFKSCMGRSCVIATAAPDTHCFALFHSHALPPLFFSILQMEGPPPQTMGMGNALQAIQSQLIADIEKSEWCCFCAVCLVPQFHHSLLSLYLGFSARCACSLP